MSFASAFDMSMERKVMQEIIESEEMDMSDIPRVKIVNERESWIGTQCYINDKKIERVKAVDFRVAVNEVPTFCFEMTGFPEIDMPGDVRFSFAPKTVQESVKVLRNELLKHGEIYNAFRDSIQSVLKSKEYYIGDGETIIRAEFGSHYLAEEILKRMIGEE